MSWFSCYSGSNNIHSDFPPLMSDGRNFMAGDSTVNNVSLRQKYGITDNYQYRQFLINNGDSIVKHNQEAACDQCCFCPHKHSVGGNTTNGGKYLYKSCTDDKMPYGFEGSDLKRMYTSSQALQSRLFAPLL